MGALAMTRLPRRLRDSHRHGSMRNAISRVIGRLTSADAIFAAMLRTVALPLVLAACGFRTASTDSFYICANGETALNEENGTGTGAGTGARPGSCDAPFELPFDSTVVRSGRLTGCSSSMGWCGHDGGTEDVFRFRVPRPVDVSIRFDPKKTDFVPTLRVVRSTAEDAIDCADSTENSTDACLYLAGQDPAGISWYAEPEHEYYVFVDSPSGSRGEYTLELRTGPDAVSTRCTDGVIDVNLGETPHFEHSGTLPRAHGFVDGTCGGPRAEQTFRVTFPRVGRLTAQLLEADFWSVLSLGLDCPGSHQYVCLKETTADQFAPLLYAVGEPGTIVYLAVDQQRVSGGEFSLTIDFE